MILKLKKEYCGIVISKNIFGIGTVTFDALKIPTEYYQNYFDLGFDTIFDKVAEERIPIKKPKK